MYNDRDINKYYNSKAKFVVEFIYVSADLPESKMSIAFTEDLYFYSYPMQITEPQISQTNFISHITKTLKGRNSKVL